MQTVLVRHQHLQAVLGRGTFSWWTLLDLHQSTLRQSVAIYRVRIADIDVSMAIETSVGRCQSQGLCSSGEVNIADVVVILLPDSVAKTASSLSFFYEPKHCNVLTVVMAMYPGQQ